jgi:hypothetical protein
MNYSMHLLLAAAMVPSAKDNSEQDTVEPVGPKLADLVEAAAAELLGIVDGFRQEPVSPARALEFEKKLQDHLRDLGRQTVQWTYNHLEPSAVQELPKHVEFERDCYTRLNKKTPQHAWTLFGQIRLRRVGYRSTEKNGEPTLFPLALGLGLVHGASPALAERAARLLADTGMTQNRTLARLRQDCGVGWGVKKLRQVTAALSEAMTGQRHEVQVERLLALLAQADASKGRHKPVLSVGRDGITLGIRCQGGRVYEVASTGTVSVLDRRGRRLGTVYLAYTPESCQGTMSQALTQLLKAVFERWQKSLPRLSYVTDSGDNETNYYEKVLCGMRHPLTGEELEWIRVVDYYHASERVWAMADLLFGKGRHSASWARKMQKWLKKPGGVNRVLHSAAAFRDQYRLRGQKLTDFRKAYRYLRDRMAYMRYAEYRRLGVPMGSGVTEAACKTVYTERLKLSGMRWKTLGAQTILNLRVLLLSGVWDQAYARVLKEFPEVNVRGQRQFDEMEAELAA